MHQKTTGRGVFGLELTGLNDDGADMQVSATPQWPTMSVTVRQGAIGSVPSWIGDDDAGVSGVSSWTHLVRQPLSAELTLSGLHHTGEVIQPFLGVAAAIASQWLGRTAFHAGAFVADNGYAIGFLGAKGAGKSTVLATMESAGVPILTDDLLVVGQRTAFAGPRCVDLRGDAAAALGIGAPLGVIGARERWRVSLPPISPETTLAGWVVPEWGDRLELTPVRPAKRLPLLVRHRALAIEPPSALDLLDLVALPCWRLVRPPRWDVANDIVAMLRSLPSASDH